MMMNKIDLRRAKEGGNVLFLILIAVALFAALSYAVTQSTRSSGGDAGRETNRINSAQLTQYPASVRTAIVRMIISGSDPNRLEFNSSGDFGNCLPGPIAGEFPNCVFHPTGGGATALQAPRALMADGGLGEWRFNAENEIEDVGTTTAGAGVGLGTSDLIAFLPNISLGICESINEELGLPFNPIPVETGVDYLEASDMINTAGTPAGQPSFGNGGGSIGVAATALAGQPFGCFNDTDGNADNGAAQQYVYYHVLIER